MKGEKLALGPSALRWYLRVHKSLWRKNIQPSDLLRLDCQRQHQVTGKTGHFLLLNQKQWGWGQKLAKGGRDQFVKETGLEPGEDKGIILKQRPIEGLPLVSAVLSVKPVLLHTWVTRVALRPCISKSLTHSPGHGSSCSPRSVPGY